MHKKLEVYLQSWKLLSTGESDLSVEAPAYIVTIYTPTIWKGTEYSFGDYDKSFKIQAFTGLVYTTSSYHSYASIAFFGFGISLSKQWGY